jgi:hypothetical protein
LERIPTGEDPLMSTPRATSNLTRRSALAGLGAGGFGMALGSSASAAPKTAAISTAGHQAVGTWLLMTSATPTILMLTADGLAMSCGMVNHVKVSPISPAGYPGGAMGAAAHGPVIFSSPSMGFWEATSDRELHVALTAIETDGDGAFIGTTTIESFPVIGEDGMSFTDDGLRTSATARDATFSVVAAATGGSVALTAHRIAAGFPVPTMS